MIKELSVINFEIVHAGNNGKRTQGKKMTWYGRKRCTSSGFIHERGV
jgi:hypothetical protein